MRPVNPKPGLSNRRIAGLLAALTLVVLARLLIVLPVFDATWLLAMIAGYVAVLALLALIVLRGGAHRWVAWLALAAAALHAGVLLWLESAVRDRYLQFSAPAHMLAAWLAGAALLALWITALPALRKRTGWHFVSFRRWHIVLAVLALLLTGYHALTRSVVFNHPALRGLAQESPLRAAHGNVQHLPVKFEHADHGTLQCTQCHHNFVDGSGSGSCFLCHQATPALAPRMELDFHALCQDCHRKERKAGHAGGPVQQCSGCHPRTQLSTTTQ